MPLYARFMEYVAGPSGKSIKKEKGKKPAKEPRGKEEKDQMKYQFHGVECTSKIIST